ncbi:endonuclease [Tenacibaculum geojense]|uniref:Endonuclease n=2 Tax=Tenacibaculum geojense TaxID=915352 RepID=A0ABW3JN85_9FLAO
MKKLLSTLFLSASFILSAQQAYYDDVDLTKAGIALKNELATKITATHTTFLTYTPGVWEASKATDVNPDNTQEVLLVYGFENGTDQDITNDRQRGINNNGGGNTQWNREHVFPRSLGNPNLGTEGPGADAHHLRPADPSRNSSRSNRKFGRGSGNSGFSSIDFHDGNEGPNTAAWYPGDEWKGDVARMMMYMYLRYGEQCLPTAVGVGSDEFTPDQMIDLFLEWNVEDPVSDFERARNDFHESNNQYAQGNRNPFIDNPYLATRIWGGDSAEDTWGIYTSSDTEAPTVPADVSLSNITMTSIDVSWTASTDNVEVTGYEVYVNNVLEVITTNTMVTIGDLSSNTTYSFTVLAKDLINNKSELSTPVNGTTLADNEAPSTPANVVASNITDTSFNVSWDASTDNIAVVGYDIFLDGSFHATTTDLTYNITGLSPSTSYSARVVAKDAADNLSDPSIAVNITTNDGNTGGAATELFISEYVEPNGGNNKAIEIVNLTGSTVDLTGYSLRKQSNGAGGWIDDFDLASGTVTSIVPNDVFVVIHEGADDATLVQEADLLRASNNSTNNGSPLNFNGNDPIGLFKNGVLIDVVGNLDGGSGNTFAQNVTLRRKSSISAPNNIYDANEWDVFSENTFDGIGSHTFDNSLSTTDFNQIAFKYYPNPSYNGEVTIQVKESTDIKNVKIYSVIGKEVYNNKKPEFVNNKLKITNLHSGVYLLKISDSKNSTTKKLIIQ